MTAESTENGITEAELVEGYGRNGDGTTAFPLDSFQAAAVHLRRPFTAAAVKFKVQAVWPKAEPTGGLIVSYIDARLVVERLNLLVPHLWEDAYEPLGGGLMWCHLTVGGITRKDVGEGKGKGLVSDALKRAAVKFGIGVSLYATPKMILNKGEYLKPKQTSNGPTLELTPNGDTHVRGLYASWLDAHGVKAFGRPLDHGDVEGAQGDIETDDPPAQEANAEHAPALLDDEKRNRVLSAIADADQDEGLLFAAVGVSSAEELTVAHALQIRALLDKALNGASS